MIPFDKLGITREIKGVIHVGAHSCEERFWYHEHFRIGDDKILWFDALKHKVEDAKKIDSNIRIFNECIADEDNKTVEFKITNNLQSSSILDLKTHLQEHPWVFEVSRIKMQTRRLDTFFREHGLNSSDYNFINLDIQGAEFLALKGCGDMLKDFDYIYTEVNERELYEGCCLLPELDSFLKEWGFHRVITNMSPHGWGDAFYVKN